MKSKITNSGSCTKISRNSFKLSIWPSIWASLFIIAIAAALMLAAGPAQAQITNTLLVNNSFEQNSGNTFPIGWTYFAPPGATARDYWIVTINSEGNGCSVSPEVGTNLWKQWNELYSGTVSNVAGIYQTFGSAPGSIYQANGYFTMCPSDETPTTNDYAWIQVEFLDANSNLLALYKSGNFTVNVGTTTWFQFQVTNACDITQPVLTGDPSFNTYAITGAVSQLVAPGGTALVRYRYCAFWAGSEGGSVYFDNAALDQVSGPVPPVISSLNPVNEIFVPPSNGLSFNVSSPSGFTINNSGIQVVVNGTNVSSSLTITGSAASKNVTYNGLQSNSTYNATITVTDTSNLTSSASTYFQTTWVGVPAYTYLWEAEDFDFDSGMYIDDPVLCNACCETNCYFGQLGVVDVDEYPTCPPTEGQFYRAGDQTGTVPSGDYSRPNLFAAGRIDYCINPFCNSSWLNYTRDWPANSTNWIIGRFANGATAGGSALYSITPTSTNLLGYFVVPPTPSWTTYEFFYLQDTNLDGQNATVVLTGKETLQLVAGVNGTANALPTFFMLVPAEPDLPYLSNLYPDGKHPFEPTNALSFTVTTLGATFPANGIQVILDGNNVSSNLVITGSSSSNNVAYPSLQPNAMHVAIINVTNSLGHGISITNQFDTFNQSINASIGPNIYSNYIFEAADYDYNGGQYVPSASYYPDCYTGFTSVTNVDFHHTYISGETNTDYPYRINGIPQQVSTDYLLADYAASFSVDYILIDYGAGDWANYTRDYPLGTFNVYARASGLGTTAMDFGQVVSGGGTTNQVVKPLGQFISTLPDIDTFAWVPLTDSGGVAPVTVKIIGVTTFQVETPTGDVYPNYYMLVPTSPIHLSAARSGNNINLSFPTQTGWDYRVFYRTNLAAGSWTLLNSTFGNGSLQTVTDSSAGGSQRFYMVTSP